MIQMSMLSWSPLGKKHLFTCIEHFSNNNVTRNTHWCLTPSLTCDVQCSQRCIHNKCLMQFPRACASINYMTWQQQGRFALSHKYRISAKCCSDLWLQLVATNAQHANIYSACATAGSKSLEQCMPSWYMHSNIALHPIQLVAVKRWNTSSRMSRKHVGVAYIYRPHKHKPCVLFST